MILAGGTVFGVQPAGAADDTAQQIRELQQGVNANRTRIAQIEEKQAASQDYSTDIKANADGIAANKKAIGDNTTAIASNKSAIAAEKTARENGETSLNDRITNVKEYLQKDAADTYVTKDAAAVQDGAIVKAKDTIGNNVTNLDAGLAKETAARIGADKAQDKVIEQVNENASKGIAALKTAYDNETAAREAADNTEKAARESGDKALDDRITNVKEYLQKDAADTYVTKDDAAVKDGAIVKAKDTIGNNVTNLDAGLAKETAARIGADKAQDKVIEQVNENASKGIAALKTAYDNETAAREAADNTEKAARESGDKALDDRITNVKEYLQKDAADTYVTKDDAAVKDGAIVKAKDTIGNNVTNLDAGLAKETAARIGADKAQDKVIEQVNENASKGIAALKTAYDNETAARVAEDKALDDRITNVKEYLQKDAADTYVTKDDAAVQDGAIVKAKDTIGNNVTNLDAGLAKETAARIGADKAQDKVIQQVNENASKGIAALKTAYDQAVSDQAAINKSVQDTLNSSGAVASADATEAAKKAAAKANEVADGLKDRIDVISGNQDITSESDLIKKDQSIGQNLTNVDTALHKEIAARTAADKTLQDNIDKEASDRAAAVTAEEAARTAADTKEANARTAADKTLQNNIDKEANDRAAAVTAEEAARTAADTKEANERTAADKTLQDNIDKEASDRAAAVTAEEAARTAADTKEANERTAADNALQTGLNKEIATREDAVTRLQNRIHDVSKEVDTVGALSMAMSGLHPLSYDEGDARFQLSAAVGTYDGTQALALGGFYHFNHDTLLSVGVATDIGGDEHRMGANIGFTKRIGQGGRMTSPSEGTVSDIMNDIRRLEQKQAELEQENAVLKQQVAALQK